VLSVPSDPAASASYQVAPPKAAQPDPSRTSGGFSDLVDSALPADPASTQAPAPEPPAPQRTTSSETSPPPSTSSNAGSDQNAAANPPNDSSADSTPPAPTSPTAGKSGGNQSAAAKSASSKQSDGKSSEKTAADTTTATNAAGTQAADATTTPAATVIALATAIPIGPQPPVANATSALAGNSAAPLAIAAAAIAASSSTAAAIMPPAAPTSGGSATGSGAIATGRAPIRIGGQATGDGTFAASLDGPTETAAAPDGSIAAAADAAKGRATTGFVAPSSAQSGPSATGFTGPTTEATTATTPAVTTPAIAAPQSSVAGKTGNGDTTVNPTNPDTAPAATAPANPPTAPRDHAALDTGTQPSTATGDTSAQAAAAAAQQQPASPSSTPTAPNFTAIVATGAPVPVSGLAVEIAATIQSGRTRFELRLDPADLGRIDVRIDVDRNGQVISHLTVEKPETLAILQQDAPQLQQALNDAGLKTGSGGLQFSLRDQSSSGQNSGNQANGNAQQLVISEDDSVPAVIAGQSYGRMLGTSGGIDIRV
jgi:flagellar hook-length control protein FliK